MRWNRWSRRLHRWGAFAIALPLLMVVVSGLLLQIKKQFPWVQPKTMKGTSQVPQVGWTELLGQLAAVAEANVTDWRDIDRLDVRPKDGIVKVQCKNRWEVQLDLADGRVCAVNYRRSDLIESLHDGTFFGDAAKLWIFLPNGLILLGLWFTGLYLWYLPVAARRKKRLRSRAKGRAGGHRGP